MRRRNNSSSSLHDDFEMGSIHGSVDGNLDRSVEGSERESISHRAEVNIISFQNQDYKLESQLMKREFVGSTKSFKGGNGGARVILGDDATSADTQKTDSSTFLWAIRRPVLSNTRSCLYWGVWIGVLSILTIFISPYRLAFESIDTATGSSLATIKIAHFELFADIVFCLDLVLNAFFFIPTELIYLFKDDFLGKNDDFLAYRNQTLWRSLYCDERLLMCRHYFSKKVNLLLLLSSFPIDFIANRIGLTNTKALFGIGITRLFRIVYVLDVFNKQEQNVRNDYFITRFVRFLLVFAFEGHLFACIFYFVAMNNSNYEETWLHLVESTKYSGVPELPSDRYLLALYWSVVTIATLGYGDITPQNSYEYVTVIVFLLVNVFTTAWITGNVVNLITQTDESTRLFRAKFKRLERYMKISYLPDELKENLRSYMMLKFNVAKENRDVLEEFPSVLRSRVHRLLYRPTIEGSFIGSVASDGFIDSLSCLLSLEMFMPGTDVVLCNDSCFEMFFLLSGTAEVYLKEKYADLDVDRKGSMEYDDDLAERVSVASVDVDDVAELDRSAHGGSVADSNSSPKVGRSSRKRAKASKMIQSFDGKSAKIDVNHRVRHKDIIVSELLPGSIVGDVAFLFNLLQPFSVRTRSICRFLKLSKESWSLLRSTYPEDARLCQLEIARIVKDKLASVGGDFRGNEANSTSVDSLSSLIDSAPNALSAADTATSSAGDGNSAVINSLREIYTNLNMAASIVLETETHDKVSELCIAAASSNVFALRKISHGFDVNMGDYDNRTALHIAASKGATSSVKFLLDRGADPNVKDVFGNTPLYEAVRMGHDDCAKCLFKRGATLGLDEGLHEGKIGRSVGTLLCQLASSNDVSMLSRLTRFKVNPNATDYDGRTALHLASANGFIDMIRELLTSKANINAVDKFGRTPLVEAIRSDQISAADFLYRNGASILDKNKKDSIEGALELCRAVYFKDTRYLKLLLQFGLSPNVGDYDNRRAAHIAVAENDMDIIIILFQHNADFFTTRVVDRWGMTPYDAAVKSGFAELVTLMDSLRLSFEADVAVKSIGGVDI